MFSLYCLPGPKVSNGSESGMVAVVDRLQGWHGTKIPPVVNARLTWSQGWQWVTRLTWLAVVNMVARWLTG